MKRFEIWLGIVIGCIFGISLGYFLGRGSVGNTPRRVDPRAANSPIEWQAGGNSNSTVSDKDGRGGVSSQFQSGPTGKASGGVAKAISDALQSKPPFNDAHVMLLIESMQKEDFPAALQALKKGKAAIGGGGLMGPPIWIAFWQRFGEIDPATALASALASRDLDYPNRNYLEKHLFTGMARVDPEAAAAAFLAHPELPNRSPAIAGMIEIWANTNPKGALAWAANLEGDLLTTAVYGVSWGVATKFDISAANNLVKDVPAGPAQDAAIRSLKSQISQKPELPAPQLLDFVGVLREVGARDRSLEMKLATRTAASDPYAAANFFAQPLPDGAENDFKEFAAVAASWIRKDAKAAENWAKGQEAAPAYDVMAAEFVRAAQERNDDAEEKRWMEKIEAHRRTAR